MLRWCWRIWMFCLTFWLEGFALATTPFESSSLTRRLVTVWLVKEASYGCRCQLLTENNDILSRLRFVPSRYITPSVAWRRERRRKRKRSTIFLERTRKGHRQSDQHWNCFKGNIGEIPQRRGGALMGLPERIDTILNWTELDLAELNSYVVKKLLKLVAYFRLKVRTHCPNHDTYQANPGCVWITHR